MKAWFKFTTIIASSIAILSLTGCAAIGTAVSHRKLETQTEMSNSVFLTPVTGKNRSVYVQVTNTTGVPSFNIQQQLVGALSAKGYQVYTNPNYLDKAHYLLQVNLLRVGRMSETAAKKMLGGGYGGALEGAVTGAAIAGVASNGDAGWALAGGLIGAIGDTIISNSVKDVTYSGIVDVKITEQKEHKSYNTRIATSANQTNLEFKEAEKDLEVRLGSSIAGLFS